LNGRLLIFNRQRTVPVNTGHLRRLTRALLQDLLQKDDFTVGVSIVDSREMTRLNETFLQHEGSTDVITFDYSIRPSAPGGRARQKVVPDDLPRGEIFVCVDDAVLQARRFRTTWQSELVRYVIHGVLHLCGHDDLDPRERRVMKREENRFLRLLGRSFPFRHLPRKVSRRRKARPSVRKR
jgi:probable rRNA maturation factor